MPSRRPDPDELLARVEEEERRAARGKLTIFFGAAPGVGKTYEMLQTAHAKRREGIDTVIGIIETHGRKDTDALVAGLDIVARRKTEYNGHDERRVDVRRRPIAHHRRSDP